MRPFTTIGQESFSPWYSVASAIFTGKGDPQVYDNDSKCGLSLRSTTSKEQCIHGVPRPVPPCMLELSIRESRRIDVGVGNGVYLNGSCLKVGISKALALGSRAAPISSKSWAISLWLCMEAELKAV